MVQDAWAKKRELNVHGWVYGLSDGRLRDLGFLAAGPDDVQPMYDRAVADAGIRT